MTHLDKVLLDADICFKLGRYSKVPFIERIIPHLANEVYIHEYVYERELLTENTGKPQLKRLVESNKVIVLREDLLIGLEKAAYESTVSLLCKVMKGTVNFVDSHHRGEIVSLAMAKTRCIPIFMTDEKDLQPIIDLKLNVGTSSDFKYFVLSI